MKGLDLAPVVALELAPRLNLLTGDNSLGKSLVLDVAWWVLTGSWAGPIARPARDRATRREVAKAPASISAQAGERRMTAVDDARHERWSGGHLHPKWQRTIMGTLLEIVAKMGVVAEVQILATTHAPLVLASVEPLFQPDRDALFDFKLVPDASGQRKVDVEKEPFRVRGDVNAWLTSEVFGLRSTRSPEAEAWLERAAKAMSDPDCDRREARRIHRKLQRLLGDLDPFWIRWRFLAEKRGWL